MPPAEPFSLFVFIDALGWNVLQQSYPEFLQALAPHRKPLRTILGYSSACDPSIISGKMPEEHLHWSCFYYSPKTSPFRQLEWLRWIPEPIRDNHRTRHWISRLFAKSQGYTGYFQLYELPFNKLKYFDYSEKKWIFGSDGLNAGKSLFDYAIESTVSHYVSPLFANDEDSFTKARQCIEDGNARFAYLLLGKLDALMHSVGTKSAKIRILLKWYEEQISALMALAASKGRPTSLYLFSDHGMHDVVGTINLEQIITQLPLKYGDDYVAIYDSTMARFWFPNPGARKTIEAALEKVKAGNVLTDEQLKQLRVFFPDRRYGELIFLLEPGQLIVPSDMGKKTIPGMHGYHPDSLDSRAVVLSNHVIPEGTNEIQQLFHVFMDDLSLGSSHD